MHAQTDGYNRFVALLQYHPLCVPPLLLYRYYGKLPEIGASEKSAFLQRLAFHNAWGAFWEVSIGDAPTLSDVEDVVDVIYETKKWKNDLGVWQALEAAQERCATLALFGAICDHVSFKFGLSKGDIEDFCLFCNSIGVASVDDVRGIKTESTVKRAFLLRKLRQLGESKAEIVNIGGHVSMLRPDAEMARQALRLVRLSELDYFTIFKSLSAEDAPLLFARMCRDENLSGHTLSLPIRLSSDRELHRKVMRRFGGQIGLETWTLVFHVVDVPVLLNLKRSNAELFFQVAQAYLKEPTDEGILSFLRVSGDRLLVREMLRKLLISSLNEVLALSMTPYNWLEVWRFALRHKHTAHLAEIFSKIFKRPDSPATLHNVGAAAQYAAACSLTAAAANTLRHTTEAYLFNHFIAKSMHFVYRQHGIPGLRRVLTELEFDCVAVRAALYEHLVYEDAGYAGHILAQQQRLPRAMAEAMLRGILRGRGATNEERLDRYAAFRQELEKRGHGRPSAKTMVVWGNVTLKTGRDMRPVVTAALNAKVPLRVVRGWAKSSSRAVTNSSF